MSKTFLFLTIQLSVITQFSSILSIERTLSSSTTPGQRGPGRDGNKGVLRVSQSSSITGTSPSDCLVSCSGHSLAGFLPLCRKEVCVFYSTSWLGKYNLSKSSIGCKILCIIIINFLVIWFLSLSSSLVHSKNGSGYRGIFGCLFLWWDFCYRVLIRTILLFFWGTLF